MENEQQVITPPPEQQEPKTFNQIRDERRGKTATESETPQGDKKPDVSGQPSKDGSESGSTSEVGKTQEKQQPKRDDFTARAKQLAAETKAAQEKAEAADRENRELKERLRALESRQPSQTEPPKPADTKPQADDKPKRPTREQSAAKYVKEHGEAAYKALSYEQFEDFHDEQLDAWRDESRAAKAKEDEAFKERGSRVEQVKSSVAAARSKYSDFDQVALQVNLGVSQNDFNEIISTFDVEGVRLPEVLYYLGKHPEELKKVQEANGPPKYHRLVGIALKLSQQATPEKPKPQPLVKAGAPVKPISGGYAPSEDEPKRSEMNFNQLREQRRRQARAN